MERRSRRLEGGSGSLSHPEGSHTNAVSSISRHRTKELPVAFVTTIPPFVL